MSWDNEVAFNNGSGSGDGIDKPVVPEQPDEPGENEPIPEDSILTQVRMVVRILAAILIRCGSDSVVIHRIVIRFSE